MDHAASDRALAQAVTGTLEIHGLPPPGDLRYEVKFAADVRDLPAVLGWVTAHGAGFRLAHPDRVVNNVYFDTPDLVAYEDNTAGISRRAKLRFRWYGEGVAASKGTLEVKCRTDSVGWKWSATCHFPFDLERMSWQELRDALRAQLPTPYRLMFDAQSFATLVNRYRRSYYESRDGKLRLTVDRAIQVYPQLGRARPAIRFAAHKQDALVIEVKCSVAHRNLAADALTGIPWRASRHSKYAVGIESLTNV